MARVDQEKRSELGSFGGKLRTGKRQGLIEVSFFVSQNQIVQNMMWGMLA